MTKLPSITVRNAIAFADVYGDWFSHMHMSVRWEAERVGVKFVCNEERIGGRFRWREVSDEARAIAATGTLAPCLAYAKEHGFEIDDTRRRRATKPKPGYIPLINRATGEEAFISNCRRVYRHPAGVIGYEVAFEGKPSKLAK